MATIQTAVDIDIKVDGTQTVNQAATAYEDLGDAVSKTQLEAEKLAQQFGINDARTQEAIKAAGRYKAELEQLDFAIDAAKGGSDQLFRASQGVLGGFEAAAGAAALFGGQSEALEATLVKLQGAMALSQGLKDFNEFAPAIKNVAGTVTGPLTKAFKGFGNAAKTAIASTGIGALVVGVGVLVTYWDDIKETLFGISDEQTKMVEKQRQMVAQAEQQLSNLELQENSLRLQGMSEETILRLKKQQLETAVEFAITNVESAEHLAFNQKRIAQRNKDILQGIIRFITLPIVAILKGVDLITAGLVKIGAMDKALNLEAGFSGGLAGMVFDVEEVEIEGDKSIQEAKNKLAQLRNQLDGYRLAEKKSQEQGNKSTTDNQKQLNDELEKLRAENLADAEAKALELLRIEYQKHRQELIDKKASQELLLELDKNYGINQQQIRDDFAEQRKAKEEEDAKALEELRQKNADEQKAREEKEYADSLANVENFYKQKQLLLNQSLINGEITQEQYDQKATSLETDLLEAKLQVQRDYGDNSIDTELAISQQQIDINAQRNEAIKAQDEALKEAKDTLYNNTVALGDALIGLVGEQTKAGKGLALAQIAADTARALSGALANANSPTPDNIATGGLAGIAKYIALATQILGNAKRARDILKGQGSASVSTGGGATAVPQISTRQFQASSMGQDFTGSTKVYVTEGDISRTQKRVNNLQRVSVVGG